MANPPPDGMNDDFFDQIFSMPAAYGGTGDGGALSYGDSSASAAGFNAGGPSMFSLGLSLDQQQQQQQVKDAGGKRIRGDDQEVKRNPSEAEIEHPVQLTSLFPPYGHSQVHHIRPNPPPQVSLLYLLFFLFKSDIIEFFFCEKKTFNCLFVIALIRFFMGKNCKAQRIAERIRALQELVPSTNKNRVIEKATLSGVDSATEDDALSFT